ncbi:hypothetical protein [Wukongibacter sp. M2B1]|uniref:hypothetical protein n=1 Tax=Wukongibacter sp. M2B1 TaxID=3088895 RepID=UPI003D7B125F
MTKKDEIITIAADLIHEYGYNNIGIKRILDEANITMSIKIILIIKVLSLLNTSLGVFLN